MDILNFLFTRFDVCLPRLRLQVFLLKRWRLNVNTPTSGINHFVMYGTKETVVSG